MKRHIKRLSGLFLVLSLALGAAVPAQAENAALPEVVMVEDCIPEKNYEVSENISEPETSLEAGKASGMEVGFKPDSVPDEPFDEAAAEESPEAVPTPLAGGYSGNWRGEEYWDDEASEWKYSEGTWTLDEAGTLTINGIGALDSAPWNEYKDSVHRVVIGAGVARISSIEMFSNYKSLTEVVLSDTVSLIGDGVFSGCTALAKVTLGEGLTSIGYRAFQGTGLTEIGEDAFAECDQLNDIAVAAGNSAFKTLDGVIFSIDGATLSLYPSGRRGPYSVPAGVKNIGASAFSGSRGLTAVTLPKGLESIGARAFYGCDALANATLPEGLETIGEGAFSYCSALTDITLPEGLKTIGEAAFSSCYNLKKAVLPGTLARLGENVFQGCSRLTDLTLGEGISRIENGAFRYCSALFRLMLPKSLTYIGSDAFTNATRADIHYAGTQAEWEALRKGYNALPNSLAICYNSTGPVEPDLDYVERDVWDRWNYEQNAITLDISLIIDNGGPAGDITVLAALYDRDKRFQGLQKLTLPVESGRKTYNLEALTFPGIEPWCSAQVFLTNNGSVPLY